MLDINGTFLIQLGLFLAFMVILNQFLFVPMRAYRARRQRTIDELKATAGGSDAALAALSSEYSRKIGQAREEIGTLRATARRETLELQKSMLEEARRQVVLTVDAAEDELARETKAAREALARESQILANAITAKILGRAV
jgi:F-type H+-transporting ATPase subunit b